MSHTKFGRQPFSSALRKPSFPRQRLIFEAAAICSSRIFGPQSRSAAAYRDAATSSSTVANEPLPPSGDVSNCGFKAEGLTVKHKGNFVIRFALTISALDVDRCTSFCADEL